MSPSETKVAFWSRWLGVVGRRRKRWKKLGEVYTWDGYGWGVRPPPEAMAEQYFGFKLIARALDSRRFSRSLEIGCGWGRRTPWIAEFSDEAHAIEPNGEVLRDARGLYRDVAFRQAGAQAMPYADGHFDLVVSWAVLQHVPPDQIESAAAEIKRVLAAGGVFLLLESMKRKRSRPPIWYREKETYEELFSPLELSRSVTMESVSAQEWDGELLRFDG